MKDWIELFLDVTEGMRSPPAFRLWAAITTVAGALERRVWTATDTGLLYPNMFTILTGEPAAGKSLMVLEARKIWTSVHGLKVGPDNPTKASFLDSLFESLQTRSMHGKPFIYCAMNVACREFGVLFQHNDRAFMEDLTDLYDNPPKYSAPRRTSKSVSIDRPTINVLAAVTPDKLGDFMPEAAWGQGFTSRLLFIYGVNPPTKDRDIFKRQNHERNYGRLVDHLTVTFNDLFGEFEWEEDAAVELNRWYNAGMEPVPTYSRLRHYLGRRDSHAIKLAMISAVSSKNELRVERSDVDRALYWLIEAEKVMPDVFRAMAQKSDIQLLEDLYNHLRGIWATIAKEKRQEIHESELWQFLSSRVPSERISRIIEMMHRTGRMRPGSYAGTWIPNTRDKIIQGSGE